MRLNQYNLIFFIILLLSSTISSASGFVHNPEIFKLIEKHFPGKNVEFTDDIELPAFDDREYRFDSPNRLDHHHFTYPYKMQTDIDDIDKFAIFILQGTDSYDGVERKKFDFIEKEYFKIEGENIEDLNLYTLIQMATRSTIYLVAQSGDDVYVNFRIFAKEKSTGLSRLIGSGGKEPIAPILDWRKLRGYGLGYDQTGLRFRGILKDEVVKLSVLFPASTSGYHYKYHFSLKEYAESFPSYTEKLEILIDDKSAYAVNFSPYTSTSGGIIQRLSMDIPGVEDEKINLKVKWTDNHGVIYEKQQALESNIKAGKPSPTKIVNRESELYLPINAGETQKVSKLMKAGLNPNIRYPNGLTPLGQAIKDNQIDIIKVLLQNGAKVNNKFLHGVTPFMWAVEAKNIEAIEILLKAGASPVTTDNRGLSAFDRIFYFYRKNNYSNFEKVQNSNLTIIKLLSKGNKYYSDESFLRLVKSAIEYDFYNIMRYFVDSGIPPDYGDGILLRYFVEGLILDYAKKLIAKGAKINLVDENGLTTFEYMANKNKLCNDSNSYTYNSTYCHALNDEFPEIRKILKK